MLSTVFDILLLLAFNIVSAGDKITVPGPTNSLVDPTNRFSVECIKSSDSSDHQLLLVFHCIKSGRSKMLLSFARSADLEWSPDGNALAITDWIGSNVSEVLVFVPAHSYKLLNVDQSIVAFSKPLRSRQPVSHQYFEALGWRNASILRIQVSGRSERTTFAFKYCYEYTLNGKVKQVKCSQ